MGGIRGPSHWHPAPLPPLHSCWVTHLQGLTPSLFVLSGNHAKSQEAPRIYQLGWLRHILKSRYEETENTEGVACPQAAAERCDSWSAGGPREVWDPRAHPGMLLSMTLYLFLPPGSLLASVTKSDEIRGLEVTCPNAV